MNEALQKFKEAVNGAQTIAVRIGSSKDIYKILPFLILHSAFLELGKKSSIVIENISENTRKFIETILGNRALEHSAEPQNTLIKIDTDKIPVSELKYEKEGSVIKIILSSSENFDTKNIQIEKEKMPVDLLLLGDPGEHELGDLLKQTPHKEVVKITSKEKSVEQKIFEIVSALLGNGAEKFKEAFWMAFENCDPRSAEIASIKNKILSLAPDFAKIHEAGELIRGGGFLKILGRALQRSEFEKDFKIAWTFLTHSDFEKTGNSDDYVMPVFYEIKKMRRGAEFFAFLWEFPKNSIKAAIGGENPDQVKKLAYEMGLTLSSPYFFADGFSSFSEAEIKIRGSIKKMIQ
ncbi:MAG: hypothetical protein AAB556_00515 [Patescibacteria group bacterium]